MQTDGIPHKEEHHVQCVIGSGGIRLKYRGWDWKVSCEHHKKCSQGDKSRQQHTHQNSPVRSWTGPKADKVACQARKNDWIHRKNECCAKRPSPVKQSAVIPSRSCKGTGFWKPCELCAKGERNHPKQKHQLPWIGGKNGTQEGYELVHWSAKSANSMP